MSLCPFATHRLIPESSTQPAIVPRAIILHSAAGRGSLYGWWNNPQSKGLESHFWIADDGLIEQYVDTEVRADANGAANSFAVSIETESSVQATEPWTKAQLASIIRLCDWLCATHQIPRVQMPTATSSGIGWHVMFGAPGPWTPSRGKTCPGPARITQTRDVVIPALASKPTPTPPEEDDMPTADEIRQIVGEELDKRLNPDSKGNLLVRLRDAMAKVDQRTSDLVTGKRPERRA